MSMPNSRSISYKPQKLTISRFLTNEQESATAIKPGSWRYIKVYVIGVAQKLQSSVSPPVSPSSRPVQRSFLVFSLSGPVPPAASQRWPSRPSHRSTSLCLLVSRPPAVLPVQHRLQVGHSVDLRLCSDVLPVQRRLEVGHGVGPPVVPAGGLLLGQRFPDRGQPAVH